MAMLGIRLIDHPDTTQVAKETLNQLRHFSISVLRNFEISMIRRRTKGRQSEKIEKCIDRAIIKEKLETRWR